MHKNWCFDPLYRLKKTETNIYCYSLDRDRGVIKNGRPIHPLTAVILSLFNGLRNEDEVAGILSEITGITSDKSISFVKDFIIQHKQLLTEGISCDRYNPLDFMIPDTQIDLTKLKLPAPISIGLLLTYACGSDCLYCYANRNEKEDKEEMDLEFAKSIVDQALKCGTEIIYLGGGDPFVKNWVTDLIEYINHSGIVLFLSTKEYLSPEKCMKLAKAGVQKLQVSIDSLNPDMANMLVNKKNFFNKAMETIENLINAGISPTIKSVITKHNVQDIPALVKYFVSRGIKSIILGQYFRTFYRHSDGLFVDETDLIVMNKEIEKLDIPSDVYLGTPVIETYEKPLEKIPEEIQMKEFLDRGFCPAGRTGIIISPSGKVIPCEQLPSRAPYMVGDLRKQSLLEIWNSEKLHKIMYPEQTLFKGTPCYDCEHFVTCVHQKGWCMMETIKLYDTTYHAHPRCPKITPEKRLY